MEAVDKQVINNSSTTTFLPAAEGEVSPAQEAQGASFHLARPKRVRYPSLPRGGKGVGARSMQENTPLGLCSCSCAHRPGKRSQKSFPEHFLSGWEPLGFVGREGRGRGGGRSRVLNGAFVLAAAAPSPRQPSAEEEHGANSAPPSPAPSAFCPGHQRGLDTQFPK